jgi:hypothetical protein
MERTKNINQNTIETACSLNDPIFSFVAHALNQQKIASACSRILSATRSISEDTTHCSKLLPALSSIALRLRLFVF